jgi:acetoin utilization protein AcuB
MINLSLPVSSIMTKHPVSVQPSQTLLEVKHIFEKKDFHHHVPVTDDGLLVGMVSLMDFVAEVKDSGLDDNADVYTKRRVMDIMREHPVAVDVSLPLSEAFELLAAGSVHALAVTEDKHLVGMLSTTDTIRYFLHNTGR